MTNVDILSKTYTNTLRGICMLLIVWSHTANEFPTLLEQYHIKSFLPIGMFATGVFFFLSGYGLTLSMEKQVVDIGYLLKRIQRLLLPYAIFWFCYLLLVWDRPPHLLHSFCTLGMPGADVWFFKTIVVLYVVYIGLMLVFSRLAPWLVSILVIAYVGLSINNGVQPYWWNTLLCFPLGILYARRKAKLSAIPRAFVFLLPLLFIAVCKSSLPPSLIAVLKPIIVCLFIAHLSAYIHINQSIPIIGFVGSHSLYTYLMEEIPIEGMDSRNVGAVIFIVGGIAIAILLTYIGVGIERRLKCYFERAIRYFQS